MKPTHHFIHLRTISRKGQMELKDCVVKLLIVKRAEVLLKKISLAKNKRLATNKYEITCSMLIYGICKKNKLFSVTFPWKSFVKTTTLLADADGVTLIESKATDIFEFQ